MAEGLDVGPLISLLALSPPFGGTLHTEGESRVQAKKALRQGEENKTRLGNSCKGMAAAGPLGDLEAW